MYDAFSQDYDRFVNWQERLAFEMPQIERYLNQAGARRVLDAACGTGMHALELAQRGYEVCGADLSAGMVQTARANAAAAGQNVRFEAAGFGALEAVFGEAAFDAVLCLGNSMPHILSVEGLEQALKDFYACLRPGGLLLLQLRNFHPVMAARQRFMQPQAHKEQGKEWIFLRFYDFLPEGLIQFNVVTLLREGEGKWQQSVVHSLLRPWLWSEMGAALESAGFVEAAALGSMAGDAFDLEKSGDLVATARRSLA